jgi:hypothetical protein
MLLGLIHRTSKRKIRRETVKILKSSSKASKVLSPQVTGKVLLISMTPRPLVQSQKNSSPFILQNIRIISNGWTLSSNIQRRNPNLKEN